MIERRINCPICGREFIPKSANAKYCGIACRNKGKYQHRKEWEERSGYLEKQRQKMQDYRNQVTAAERAEREAALKREEAKAKRAETRRRNKERNKLLQDAEQGNAIARMRLAILKSGNASAEYWEAYKDYVLQYAAEFGHESTAEVNGISVHSPEFGLAVSMSIEELGSVIVHNGTRRKDTFYNEGSTL